MTARPDFRELPTWLLSQAAQRSHRVLHERLAEAGATAYEYRLLSSLHAGGECTQAELGRLAALDRRDVAVTVRSLVRSGMLARRSDPADARVRVVSLTAAGRARYRTLVTVLEAVQDELLAGLTADERACLVDHLARLAPPGEDQDRRPAGPGEDQDRRPAGPGEDQDRRPAGPGEDQDRRPAGPGEDQDRRLAGTDS